MLIEKIKYLISIHPELTGFYLIIGKIIGAIILFPGVPLTLLAGSFLGIFWGTIISLIGNVLGAMFAFYISRYLFRDLINKTLYIKYKKIKEYEDNIFRKGFITIFLIRLTPIFPFNVLNYLLGVTKVSAKDYFWGTFLGIIPGTIAFVYFGQSLMMFSIFHMILALIIIGFLMYLGKLVKVK